MESNELDIHKADSFINGWAAVVKFRANGGTGYPVPNNEGSTTRTRPDHLPDVATKHMTVERFIQGIENGEVTKALLLHCYPNVGTYYSSRPASSFRHLSINHIPRSEREEYVSAQLRKVRVDLATALSKEQD